MLKPSHAEWLVAPSCSSWADEWHFIPSWCSTAARYPAAAEPDSSCSRGGALVQHLREGDVQDDRVVDGEAHQVADQLKFLQLQQLLRRPARRTKLCFSLGTIWDLQMDPTAGSPPGQHTIPWFLSMLYFAARPDTASRCVAQRLPMRFLGP